MKENCTTGFERTSFSSLGAIYPTPTKARRLHSWELNVLRLEAVRRSFVFLFISHIYPSHFCLTYLLPFRTISSDISLVFRSPLLNILLDSIAQNIGIRFLTLRMLKFVWSPSTFRKCITILDIGISFRKKNECPFFRMADLMNS